MSLVPFLISLVKECQLSSAGGTAELCNDSLSQRHLALGISCSV